MATIKTMTHISTLLISLLALPHLGLSQDHEFTWQPIPYSQIGATTAVSGGFIITTSHSSEITGPLQIRKYNWQGELIWETALNSSTSNWNLASNIFETPTKQIIIFWSGISCDQGIPNFYSILDSNGVYINTITQLDWTKIDKIVCTTSQTDTSYVAWTSQGIKLDNDPILKDINYSIIGFDPLIGAIMAYPISAKGFGHSPALIQDVDGRVWIGLKDGGIACFNPQTGMVTDSMFTNVGLVYDVIFLPDSSAYLMCDEKIVHLDNQGGQLSEKLFPGSIVTQGFLGIDELSALSMDKQSGKFSAHSLNLNLQVNSTIDTITNDTYITGVAVHQGQTWVLGQEHLNVFAKSYTMDNPANPLRQDAHILDYTFQELELSILKQWNSLYEYTIRPKELKLLVLNNGTDTLDHFTINWNIKIPPVPLFSFCNYLMEYHSYTVKEAKLAPGESDWFFIPGVEFIKIDTSQNLELISFNPCLELTCPNNHIDADHSNDTLCLPIELLISSQSEPERAATLTCFPNPFTNQITLENIPEEAQHFSVFDQWGRIVLKSEVNSPNESIILPSGPGGMYAIVAFNKHGQINGSYRLIRMTE